MENKENIETNIIPTNYVDNYFNKLVNYSGKGLVIGALTSYLFVSKWKMGAILGFGIGAGYCNPDLTKIFKKFKE